MDLDKFFPEHGGHTLEAARATCASCPVQPECLDFSLRENIEFGMWGGVSEKQRRKLRRIPRDLECAECRTRFTVPGRVRRDTRFCSPVCQKKNWHRMNPPQRIGRTPTDEQRARMSELAKARYRAQQAAWRVADAYDETA